MEGAPSKSLFHTTQYNLDILQVGFEVCDDSPARPEDKFMIYHI
jgi:hypothetical protein